MPPGWVHAVTVEEMVRLIAAAGLAPVQRDTLYGEVRRYPTGPDGSAWGSPVPGLTAQGGRRPHGLTDGPF